MTTRSQNNGQAKGLPVWARYAIAVLAQVPFFALLKVTDPYLPLGEYPVIYAAMLMAVVYYLGEGPAVPVFVIDFFAFLYYYLLPMGSLALLKGSTGWNVLLAYVVGSGIVVFAAAAMTRSKGRAERLAEALRESDEDLNRAQAVARTGSWRLNVRRNELLWSDQTYRMFGIPKGTPLTYEAFLATVHPDDREYVDTNWQAALRGEHYDIEHRIVVGGEVKWVSETAELEFDDEGGCVEGFGTVQDVTERKQIERAKDVLLEREHRIAETLQQALIPSVIPYVFGNWSAAARYQPALREAQVGGDFYDVFQIGQGKYGVLIGDIAGKGLAAAIHVAAVRHAIRSYAYMDPSPARVMALTNDALCREGADEQEMLSAFLAVVDPADYTIIYANAGHEPPVVRTCRGDIVELEVTGPMLGVVSGSEYCERAFRLEPGDSVVIFTDGITEARRQGALFERDGVIEHLSRIGDASPDEIAETLMLAAAAYAGGSLQDDAAIIVLEYKE